MTDVSVLSAELRKAAKTTEWITERRIKLGNRVNNVGGSNKLSVFSKRFIFSS